MVDFFHDVHPHTEAVRAGGITPPKVGDDASSLNERLGVAITRRVGTMGCAYLFAVIALISLPTVLEQVGLPLGFDFGSGTLVLVAWVAQTFLQLVLLSIIMVGQGAQGKAADQRAEATYTHAVAILHECLELQRHLQEQDKTLRNIVAPARQSGW